MKNLMMKIARQTMKMNLDVDGRGVWDWGAGVALYGLFRMYDYTKEKEIFDYIKNFVDYSMDNNMEIPKTVNTTAPLCSALMLYTETGDKKYLDICIDFARWLVDEAPRTQNGALAHSGLSSITGNVKVFAEQVWVDTIFMAGVFLTRIGTIVKNKEFLAEGSMLACGRRFLNIS